MAKSKIIKDIANGEVDTITALKRTKVLVSDLNNPEIIKWIDHEISGYPTEATIPSYRKVQGNLVGSYFKGSMASHMTWKNVSIPLGEMPDDTQKKLLSIEFYDGVESLRKLAQDSQASGNQIGKTIPADFFPAIATYNNDPFMNITSARVVISGHIISNIFSVVESKLLDVLMILEKEFGPLDELDIDTESKSDEEIKDINSRILVLVYNDNSVTMGDGNKIKDSTIASEIK